MDAFSSSEAISLEQTVDIEAEKVTFAELWGDKQKNSCYDWIRKNKFKKVCLQFPDSYLIHSTTICTDLKDTCGINAYILADTSYGSCCIDEISAAHIDADGIIHFGIACLSITSSIPVLYIFPHFEIDVQDLENNLYALNDNNKKSIGVYFDYGFYYVVDKKKNENLEEQKCSSIKFFKFPDGEPSKKHDICVFIGCDDLHFFNLTMSTEADKWYIYNSVKKDLKEMNPQIPTWIRRRHFQIEKCKDAQTIGLILATLTGNSYQDVLTRIQQMARARGKRTYTIFVGRINPAKLANFIEIDCFVLIGCPYNNMHMSKDFFKPILSVFEAEVALNPAWKSKYLNVYASDFKDILVNGRHYKEFRSEDIEENDISLLTGNIRQTKKPVEDAEEENTSIIRKNYQIMSTNGHSILGDRSWNGLEPALGENEPAKVEKGLSGLPMSYDHE